MRVITIGAEDDPTSAPLVKCAKDTVIELRGQTVRVDTDFGNNPINAPRLIVELWFVHLRPTARAR